MGTVLIDTDVAIDYLRGRTEAIELIAPLWEENRAYLSIITVYELYAGMRDKERYYTENFINACIVEPVTIEIAKAAGELYRKFRTKGINLTSLDCLIAATASAGKHKIATRNKNHYPSGLQYV